MGSFKARFNRHKGGRNGGRTTTNASSASKGRRTIKKSKTSALLGRKKLRRDEEAGAVGSRPSPDGYLDAYPVSTPTKPTAKHTPEPTADLTTKLTAPPSSQKRKRVDVGSVGSVSPQADSGTAAANAKTKKKGKKRGLVDSGSGEGASHADDLGCDEEAFAPIEFSDDVTNEELDEIVELHFNRLRSSDSDVVALQTKIDALQSQRSALKGFHTIHARRDLAIEIESLQARLSAMELNTDAHAFRARAQKLLSRIRHLKRSSSDIAVVEGLAAPAAPVSSNGNTTGNANGNPSTAAATNVAAETAPATHVAVPATHVPRRRQVALAATRNISFGNIGVADADADTATCVGGSGGDADTSHDNQQKQVLFRELLLDDFRALLDPAFVRPAYRVSENECSRCKGTLSLVAGQNVMVCDNPACMHEQKAATSHVGFGNREHMSLSNCRYKRLTHYCKHIKQSAKKLHLKALCTPAQFYDLKHWLQTTQKQTSSDPDRGVVPFTEDLVQHAVKSCGYSRLLGKPEQLKRLTAMLNYNPPSDYNPEQKTMMIEVFMLLEPVYAELQAKGKAENRVNFLNYPLLGTFINSLFDFGKQHKKRFKILKGTALAASQQRIFALMMKMVGLKYKFINLQRTT